MSKKHEKYLENVLSGWVEFCKAHRRLAEAVAIVLEDLKSIRQILNEEEKNEEKEKADNED